MKHKTLLTVASAICALGVISVAAAGCGDDDSGTTTKTDAATDSPVVNPGDTSTGETSTTNPPVPTLGAQIDRMGRPAINTALNATFETDATKKGQAKDKYNQDSTIAGWKATWIAEASGNLAVLDALDTVCGNSFLSTGDAAGPPSSTYGALGGVAADDRLWIKMDATTCTTYLAVEANATNTIPNMDCGGRGLTYDVIDVTYSAAAIGAVAGVDDGILKDDVKTGGAAFPFLAAPLQ